MTHAEKLLIKAAMRYANAVEALRSIDLGHTGDVEQEMKSWTKLCNAESKQQGFLLRAVERVERERAKI